MKKTIKNKNGFATIELLLVSSLTFALILMFIAAIGYVSPVISIQRDIRVLSSIAEETGGLTLEQVETFKVNLKQKGYLKESELPIIVEGITDNGFSAIGVNDGAFITQESNDVMTFNIKVPANDMISKFNSTAPPYYSFTVSVLSERSIYD